jgi:hypothetical protein
MKNTINNKNVISLREEKKMHHFLISQQWNWEDDRTIQTHEK